MRISAAAVHRIAEQEILHRRSNRRKRVSLERFSVIFGCSPGVAAALWNRLDDKDLLPEDALIKHLLWSLSFLKLYNVQRASSPVCGADKKTYRKWLWAMLDALAELDLIKWENRFMKSNGSICLITVDGTDFLIDEPSPFDKKWCSHKFKHAALRYEIAICIQTGWIVWVNGPYPAGQWPDLSISRDGLNQALKKGEMFVADGGYHDSHGWSTTPTGYNTRGQYMKAVARARHECVNG